MTDMKDKVALITGSSSGIGRATAEAFAARGARVVLAARHEDELASLASEIGARGGAATFITTDVSVAKDVERMVAHTIETFGRLDYAVNNAGIEGKIAGILDLLERDWDQVLDINLKGTFLCLQHEARAMLAGGHGGAIVNVGSINSFLGFPGGSAYVASKHGLIGLTSSVSAELAAQGIRVNLVCPGIIDTPMHRRGTSWRQTIQRRFEGCACQASRPSRRDCPIHRLPLLRRGQLPHRHRADARWWVHFDHLSRTTLKRKRQRKSGVLGANTAT